MKSPTWDETGHLAAGLAYIESGSFGVNSPHPPLMKELCGLFLRLAGVRWPNTEAAQALLQGNDLLVWPVGSHIIQAGGPGRVMFWARLPFIGAAVLLGLLIYLWGRRLAGDWTGVCALMLYVLSPNIVAHSYLVTFDVGVAAFGMLFLLLLRRYLERPGVWRLAASGVAMGLALCAKFSAVFLVPVAAALMIVSVYQERGQRRPWAARAGAFAAMCALACAVVEAIYFFPRDPFLYVRGLVQVNANHVPGSVAFLAGEFAVRFRGYFATVYLLKEPIASIVLACAGAAVMARVTSIALLDRLFVLLPAAVLFLAHSIWAFNFGIRYIIPVLPFCYLAGGVGLAWLFQRTPRTRTAAAALCAWLVVAAAGIYPDHLSYFNELACLPREAARIGLDGGSACGTRWLGDHNVDWGQGLKQLQAWLDLRREGRTVRLGYFGSFPPGAYGLLYQVMSEGDYYAAPGPGLYVISAHLVAVMSHMKDPQGQVSWVSRMPPTAVVGHAYHVYDIPAGK